MTKAIIPLEKLIETEDQLYSK